MITLRLVDKTCMKRKHASITSSNQFCCGLSTKTVGVRKSEQFLDHLLKCIRPEINVMYFFLNWMQLRFISSY